MTDFGKPYTLIPELENMANAFGLDTDKVEKLVHGFRFQTPYPPSTPITRPVLLTVEVANSPLCTQSGVAKSLHNLVRDDLTRRDHTPTQALVDLLDALWLTSMARHALVFKETYHKAILSTQSFRQAVTEFYLEEGVDISLDNAALLDAELTMHDTTRQSYDAFKLLSNPSVKEWISTIYKESVETIARRSAGGNNIDPHLHLDLPQITLYTLFTLLPPQVTTATVAAVVGERTQFSPLEISQIVQAILDAHTAKTFA